MPTASSIYWESVNSHRSSISSGDARQYVDPWDLENYAYLRRHSISALPPAATQHQMPHQFESEYWYSTRQPAINEPGYFTPASVEELYFGTSQQTSQDNGHYQSIYPHDINRYGNSVAPHTVLDDNDNRRKNELFKKRKLSHVVPAAREGCAYQGGMFSEKQCDEVPSRMISKKDKEEYYVEVIPPDKLGLNTYGHLKIDYSSSWDSLHRKITK